MYGSSMNINTEKNRALLTIYRGFEQSTDNIIFQNYFDNPIKPIRLLNPKIVATTPICPSTLAVANATYDKDKNEIVFSRDTTATITLPINKLMEALYRDNNIVLAQSMSHYSPTMLKLELVTIPELKIPESLENKIRALWVPKNN